MNFLYFLYVVTAGVPNPGTSLRRPVRNRASQQEVNSGQASPSKATNIIYTVYDGLLHVTSIIYMIYVCVCVCIDICIYI